MIFETVKFGTCLELRNLGKFWNFLNWKITKFPKIFKISAVYENVFSTIDNR